MGAKGEGGVVCARRHLRMASLLSMPHELLVLIFLDLPTRALLSLSRVSQRLRSTGVLEEALRRRAGEAWLPTSLPRGEASWLSLLFWLELRRKSSRQTLAGGYDHSVFISRRGQVLACGHVEGGPSAWRSPTSLPSLSVRIHSVSAGSGFTLALGWLGAVFSWGKCTHGSLGHGNLVRQRTPKMVEALRAVRVEVLAAGEHHACAASREGMLWTWGSFEERGAAVTRAREPMPFGQLRDRDDEVAIGQTSTVTSATSCGAFIPARRASSTSSTADESAPTSPPTTLSTIRALASSNHTLVATGRGALFSWGRRGALGHNGSGLVPERVVELVGERIVAVAASPSHSLVATVAGALYSFGSSEVGQLGHCDWEPQELPLRVMSLASVAVIAVAVGDYCSFALSDDGDVYSWGLSPSLGHGQHGPLDVEQPVPRRIDALRHERIVALAAGPSHALAACADGRAYGWGIGCDETLGMPQLGGGDALLPVSYDPRMRIDVTSFLLASSC